MQWHKDVLTIRCAWYTCNTACQARLTVPRHNNFDAYFAAFEHTASICEYPQDKSKSLLATVLGNKAETIYTNMGT